MAYRWKLNASSWSSEIPLTNSFSFTRYRVDYEVKADATSVETSEYEILIKTKAGVDLQHIPFRGSAPMTTELLAGRVDLTFATLPSVISHIDAGALRALGVASAERAARLPHLPTLAESGVAGVEADAWFALFAPANNPAATIERL